MSFESASVSGADRPRLGQPVLVFRDIGGGDQRVEDNACLAAVHDAMIVVAQARALAARSHQGRVGVGRTDALIALALVIRGRGPVGIEATLLKQLPARRFLRHVSLSERSEMVVHDEAQDGFERFHRGCQFAPYSAPVIHGQHAPGVRGECAPLPDWQDS